jgi:CxxC-x17-CxxC domain-containing protein
MEEEAVENEEETEPEITAEEETSEDTEESKVSEEEKPEVKEVDSFNREMHKAVCADCGKECEVPFKPTEGRSVYCRDCYRKHIPQRRRY